MTGFLKNSQGHGFTIVELLIVIVVIGILATIGVIAYNGVTSGARDKTVISDADGIESEIARYGTQHSGQYGSAVQWYSAASSNANIKFTPSAGNVVDVVANSTDYCIRIYNPGAMTYKTLATAYKKGSSAGVCDLLTASTEAIADSPEEGGGSLPSLTYTFTQRTSPGMQNWIAYASSADGTKLVALPNYQKIYTSSDSGVTWTQQAGSPAPAWQSVASSADGTKLVAVAFYNYIYSSANSGVTWTQTSAPFGGWYDIASSADGTKLVAANGSSNTLYTSSDSGATWTERTSAGTRSWFSVASSSDGTKLTALGLGTSDGYVIVTSSDSGATWTERKSVSGGTVYSSDLTSSADGARLAYYVSGNTNSLFTSSDSGVTWSQRTAINATGDYNGLASSSDGIRLAVTSSTSAGVYSLHTSSDAGATWTLQAGAGSHVWQDLTSSADGTKLLLGTYNDYLYTATGL